MYPLPEPDIFSSLDRVEKSMAGILGSITYLSNRNETLIKQNKTRFRWNHSEQRWWLILPMTGYRSNWGISCIKIYDDTQGV